MTAPAQPSEPARIRVFLVDDHAVVRRGLRGYLELVDDIEIVGEATTGQAALNEIAVLVAAHQAPDVVLMDLLMPGMDGVAATRLLSERHAGIAVVAMTSYSEVERVRGALEAGASGYLLKDAEADDVAHAIRQAHRGELPLGPAVARQLARALTAPAKTTVDMLTDREREVLAVLAQGMSNKEIAHRLHVSERTARTHVSNILAKLGLRSRTQAALSAIEDGLVPPPSRSDG